MPSPSMSILPKPKSWEEFEDICTDVLKRLWGDPYVVRNGRSGQRQNGVDIYGQPEYLGDRTSDKYAGAQCKNTEYLTIDTVEQEVQKAIGFVPALTEYLLMTTASRDATLQRNFRVHNWPFRIQLMFWEDISLELSDCDELLQKHFPGWIQRTTSKQQIDNVIISLSFR